MASATHKRSNPPQEVTILQNYDVAADSKNRISLRGAQTKYFQVTALSNGCCVLEPRVLVLQDVVPPRKKSDPSADAGELKAATHIWC